MITRPEVIVLARSFKGTLGVMEVAGRDMVRSNGG